MTERTLFDNDDPHKPPPIERLPHNGTVTNRQAAELAKPFAAQQQEQVFQAIEAAGANGMTDQEVENLLSIAGNSVRPRRTALVKAGRVKDSGNLRLTKSGRSAVVWIVAPPEERPPVASKSNWPTNDKTNPNKADAAEFVLDFAI